MSTPRQAPELVLKRRAELKRAREVQAQAEAEERARLEDITWLEERKVKASQFLTGLEDQGIGSRAALGGFLWRVPRSCRAEEKRALAIAEWTTYAEMLDDVLLKTDVLSWIEDARSWEWPPVEFQPEGQKQPIFMEYENIMAEEREEAEQAAAV